MPDKPTPQPKPTNSQAAQSVESPIDVAQQPPKSIRSNLMSGQVESTPIVSEAAFAQPGNQAGPQKPVAADAKPVKPAHLKGRHSKLVGLLSVMGLLLLASVALFFTYRSYQASYQKVQKSRVSNSIAPTNVDLGGLAPTSTTLQGVGLLQVNGDANITNNVTASSFSGGGADLSNLNATNITSGTLNDARLSPNVALLNANQAFTGSNTFDGSTNFTGSSNFTGAVVLPGTLTINSLTYNMPGSQAAGTLSNDGAGNLIWQAAGACPTCVNTGGNSFGAAMSVGTNDNFDLSLRTNGITRLTFDTAGNATFAGTIVGNGSGITNLNGSNISSGTVADARLTSNVTLQGNVFNGAFQLVQLGAAGQLPALNGAALTNLDASNISAGTLSDSRLSANVTLQGNTFNAANKLVQLNGTGGLPALNGSLLTALNASNISSGTVADARLSTNVALLNANQTFSGTNAFSAGITTNTIATTTGLTVGTTSQSLALQGNGSTTLASNSGGFATTIGFSGAPVGNVNYNFDAATAAGTYGICTTVGNCASSGGGVTTLGGTTNKVAKFTGLQSIGDGSIADTGTQVTTQSTSTDSTSAFRVLNAAGTTTAFNVDTTNTRIGVGTATPSYAVDAVGDINASNGLWVAGNQVCNNTGCIAATGSGFYINNGTGTQATANFNIQSAAAGNIGGVIKGAASQTASLQEWQNSAGTTLASVSAAGTINTAGQYQVAGVQIASSDLSNNANLAKLDATQSFTGINTFQNTANSTGAFKIQNAAGSSNLLIADTTNTRIGIGTASPGYTLDVNGDVNISTGSLYRINGVAICGATGTCAPSALSTFYIQNGTGQQASANFNIVSTATGSITGILQGAVGQTADLLSLRAGDGTIVAGFSNVGVLTLGNDNGTPQAGSIVIHDNTGSNTFTSTIGTAALTASRTITFPNQSGTVCTSTDLGGSLCSGYAPGTGGAYANQQLSNLSGTIAVNLSLTPNADNTLDLGSSAASWRTLYADTSVLTPAIDRASAGALAIGNTTATSTSICNSAACDTITIGTNSDADNITIGNSNDTTILAGATVAVNGATTVTSNAGVALLTTGNNGAYIAHSVTNTDNAFGSFFMTVFGTAVGTIFGVSSTNVASLEVNSLAGGYIGNRQNASLNFGTNDAVRFTVAAGAATLTGTGATTLTSTAATTLSSAAASNLTIASGTTGAVSIDSGTSGTITMGGGTDAKTINLGTGDTGVKTIAIGGTAANVISIGNTQTAGSIAMGAAMTTGTIALGGSSMTTGNINLTGGTGAGAISLQAAAGGTILLGTVNNNAITTGTGVLTVAGNANLNGNTTIGNATTDRLTVTSQILGATPLAFQGLTDNAFYTSFAIADPTALNTVTFRDAGGTVCFESSANCGFQTSGSYFAQDGNSFGATATLGTNDAQALAFETGGTTRFTVAAGAATLTGTGATTLTSTAATTLSSAAASNLTIASGTTGAVSIDSGTSGTITMGGGTDAKTINLGTGDTGVKTIAIGGTAANVISIGNTQTAGSIAMGAAMTTGTIALGGSSMTTGNINLTGGTGAGAISLQAGAAGTILFGTVNNNAITTGTGVLTVAGDANLNGNTTIGNATTDRLTVTSQILGATPLAFQGLTDNAFYTSFAIADPTAINTVTFRDGSGTVCFESSANCGFQTSGSYFAQGGNSFGTTATLGTNDAQALAFETGGTTRFTVDSASATLTGTGATTLTSSGAMTLNSAAGSALAIGATSTTGTITIGGANSNTGTISIGGVSTLAVAETTTLNLGPSYSSSPAMSITSSYLLGVPWSNVNIGNTLMNTINIGNGATTPGTVNIGTGTAVQTLYFGTGGTGAKTVALGSSASTGATTINAGTGGIVLAGNVSGNVTFLKESAHTISIDQSTTATTVGGALSIVAGRGSNTTSGIGGALNLTGGAAGSTTGQGGAVVITGGASTGASTAGAASLKGGDGLVGGAATVSGGTGFAGGALNLTGGVGSAGAGGAITITAGTGTTTPGSITMTTTTTTTNGVTITANSSTTGVAAVVNSTAAGRTNTAFNIVATGSNSESISIADSGNTCTGNPGATFAWTCSSDQRLKTNIEDSQSILAGLSSLQVRAFDWITNNTHEKYGVLAQEVESTELSWLVKTDPETGLKSVTTPDAFMLIKGIQELNTKVDASAAGLSASVLQTLATANAITINGTLTINGVTIFNGNAKFNGDITVNQDGAGEATVVAGASSVDVVFSKELAAIPVVTASPQDFIDGQYKITSITKAGFTVSTSISQTADAKFSWTAVQK